jgi:hypothetical protein
MAVPTTEPVRAHGAPLSLHVDPALTHPDTDIEVLSSVPPKFQVVDEQSANWVIKRVMEARQYAARVKAWADQELTRAAREEKTLLFLFGRQMEQWTFSEIEKVRGRRKSLNLPAGTVGFRTLPIRLVIDDEARVLSWARSNLPDAISVVEKLSKSIVNDYSAKTGVIPDGGAHVEPECERFFIR